MRGEDVVTAGGAVQVRQECWHLTSNSSGEKLTTCVWPGLTLAEGGERTGVETVIRRCGKCPSGDMQVGKEKMGERPAHALCALRNACLALPACVGGDHRAL